MLISDRFVINMNFKSSLIKKNCKITLAVILSNEFLTVLIHCDLVLFGLDCDDLEHDNLDLHCRLRGRV